VSSRALLHLSRALHPGAQQDSEQTHDEIDLRIFQEVNECVYNDIGDFYEKYFERVS
jgi:hypothetical protein